jgi:uncharacterized membrane protein
MTYRTLVLTIHIAGVAGWLGANLTQLVLNPQMARQGREVEASWTRAQMFLGQRYYNVVGAVIAVTGVLLVLHEPVADWSSGFVWVGLAVVVLGGVLGVAVFTPLTHRRLAAIEAGDEAGRAASAQRTVVMACIDTALVLTAVLAMVHHWRA